MPMELSRWHMWWKRRGAAGIRGLLMEEWDPIGVRGIAEAANEYDGYVGAVGRMLRESAPGDELESYLTDIRETHIGLGPSAFRRARDGAVAARLVQWFSNEMRLRTAESASTPVSHGAGLSALLEQRNRRQ
jgi:hypothetical protein